MVACRLYHVRGHSESKKRKLARSVPSMIRSKLYKFRIVLYHKEALEKVRQDHSVHHDGHCTAEIRLNEQFFIKNIRQKVEAVGGNNCSVCASHEPVKKKPIIPILTSRRGQLVMFDLTKFYVQVRQSSCRVHAHSFIHAPSAHIYAYDVYVVLAGWPWLYVDPDCARSFHQVSLG